MVISCDDCVRQGSPTCGDCVVSYVLGADVHGVEIDVAAERAVRLLTRSGLLPELLHQPA